MIPSDLHLIGKLLSNCVAYVCVCQDLRWSQAIYTETDQPNKLLLLEECIHFPLNLDSAPYLCS